ncbi:MULTISPECIES: pyridoxamine 5'-phosphate oxidase family protein [unclassified Sphingobium]|uniref:pyridoxamine 5'-phosphate oxidase family protein n=1 Tax=unclassified Sphingobium TaxID=2611147 RepID=UPI000D159B3F|nr:MULTISPECIES: pyridoxamine 5'-phosphate oxidase family protein [unclassified Sphingobium]MBG6117227.1 general stress protein 26 [Sphingobium sp. JAI105]PSO11237.1 general stress protein [Sphingobium sp. AEW4]TWD12567.1 general stress protein 26 [Sphingobium sp. AEW010]TWD30338.1 general stress protein 26 [Sphingobium sp. AEW013]TWD30907.1 general stress protein 26 [Sphingobium sp. AEW001]
MTTPKNIREHFWSDMSKSPFVMVGLSNSQEHSLPMTAQLDPDADHCFWFYTSRDNRLAPGGPAMAQFAAKDHGLFACINGTLVEETDPAVIDRYWSKQVEAWYEGGRNDPNLLMLRFDLGTAEIWLADLSLTGVFKMMFGGDVSKEMKSKHAEVAL